MCRDYSFCFTSFFFYISFIFFFKILFHIGRLLLNKVHILLAALTVGKNAILTLKALASLEVPGVMHFYPSRMASSSKVNFFHILLLHLKKLTASLVFHYRYDSVIYFYTSSVTHECVIKLFIHWHLYYILLVILKNRFFIKGVHLNPRY